MSRTKGKYATNLISIKALCDSAGIDYFALYRRQKGIYKGDLSMPNKTKIANALIKDLTPFLNDLGFEVSIVARED